MASEELVGVLKKKCTVDALSNQTVWPYVIAVRITVATAAAEH